MVVMRKLYMIVEDGLVNPWDAKFVLRIEGKKKWLLLKYIGKQNVTSIMPTKIEEL